MSDGDHAKEQIAELKAFRKTVLEAFSRDELVHRLVEITGTPLNLDSILNAYEWKMDSEGEICGLVNGDMGYEGTGIKVDDDTLAAMRRDVTASQPKQDVTKVCVDGQALYRLLVALNGPGHRVRELQATRNLPGEANPINVLTNQLERHLQQNKGGE